MTEQKPGQFFLPFPFGDISNFNYCLGETQVVDGFSLKSWSLQSEFAGWSVTPDAAPGSCRLAVASEAFAGTAKSCSPFQHWGAACLL